METGVCEEAEGACPDTEEAQGAVDSLPGGPGTHTHTHTRREKGPGTSRRRNHESRNPPASGQLPPLFWKSIKALFNISGF